ncbi:MAG TPA: sugar phosphate nucleotidyltransferase [Polyangiaceae bacterium]
MTSALILAAGFGTRLHPLTLELPKPVVPVGDRPLLAHVAAACRRAGLTHLVANAHHEHEKLSAIIRSLGLEVEVVVEPEIRGTAGGVAGARGSVEPGALLVWNGDILAEPPVAKLLQLALERDAQVLAVSPRERGAGSVGMDDQGAVVRLRGQVFGEETQSGDYIGVMALGPSVLGSLPERGCLFGDVSLPRLAAGGRVWTVASVGEWSDLGDLEQYVAQNFRWLSRSGQSSFRAPSARLAPGVELSRSLIGAGAEVIGSGLVSEVIAWPGARLSAPLSRAVVCSSGRVVPFPPLEPAEN